MNIFVVNSGSSSIKYQLFKMPFEKPVCAGTAERIGAADAVVKHKVFANDEEKTIERKAALPDYNATLQLIVALLTDSEFGVIKSAEQIEVVGHRVVHGGEDFSDTTLITDEVKDKIKKLFALAPLHNPVNFAGIEVAEKIFTNAKQVAVFDTAFYHTLLPEVYRYAIPINFYKENTIRVYGFHGTSHKYVSEKAMVYLGKKDAKIISIHLGNGCSITAINGGKAIDTSMGFSPLNGLMMGTRSGDIDPSVVLHLMDALHYDSAKINTLLNKQSGMLGITGFSDMRDVNEAVENGDKEAALACEMYARRIRKYIGAYAAILNGLDAIIFTAGVGENDNEMRERVCQNMEYLNISIDKEKNKNRSSELREINNESGLVKVLVVPTNEELEIARQCFTLLTAS